MTQDPIWSANLYPYANNNPISNVDTNGKDYVNIFIEYDDLLGHAYIEVNNTIFDFGRYNGSYFPQLGKFGPIGDGALIKYKGNDKDVSLSKRLNKHKTYMFDVYVKSSDDVYDFYENLYKEGVSFSRNGYEGKIINKNYNIAFYNCSLIIRDAVREGGGSYPSSFYPHLQYIKLALFSH